NVAEIVTAANAVVSQAVPDRRQGRNRSGVGETIRLCSMLVDPVGKGFCHDRGEIAVERCPAGSSLTQKCQVRFPVIGNRKGIAKRCSLEKPIALAPIVLHPAASVRMIRIGVSTALVVGKLVRWKGGATPISETQAGLDSICAGQPAKKVVERPILHCDQ